MLENERSRILKDLTLIMSKTDELILECETDIEQTTQKKMSAQQEGDLRENVEYQTAVEKLGQLNLQMVNLQNRRESWNRFSQLSERSASEYVGEGSCIQIYEPRTLRKDTLLIVPPLLGAAEIGAITTASPVGKAALGKTCGAILEVTTPSGSTQYTIVDIY